MLPERTFEYRVAEVARAGYRVVDEPPGEGRFVITTNRKASDFCLKEYVPAVNLDYASGQDTRLIESFLADSQMPVLVYRPAYEVYLVEERESEWRFGNAVIVVNPEILGCKKITRSYTPKNYFPSNNSKRYELSISVDNLKNERVYVFRDREEAETLCTVTIEGEIRPSNMPIKFEISYETPEVKGS